MLESATAAFLAALVCVPIGFEADSLLATQDDPTAIADRQLDRAFDDFYTTRAGGTGLGLSVVRRLVADLSGTLRVETAPGAGSRFIVELPSS